MKSILFFKALFRDIRGTSAVEYGLILSLMVIGLVAAIAAVAEQTQKTWNHVESEYAKSAPSR